LAADEIEKKPVINPVIRETVWGVARL